MKFLVSAGPSAAAGHLAYRLPDQVLGDRLKGLAQVHQGAALFGLAGEVAAGRAAAGRSMGLRQDLFQGNAVDQDGIRLIDLPGIEPGFPEQDLHAPGRAFSLEPFDGLAQFLAGIAAALAGRAADLQMEPFDDDGLHCCPSPVTV